MFVMITDHSFTGEDRLQQLLSFCLVCAALSLDDQTGNFEVGKDFDALRVNIAVPGGPIDLIQRDGPLVGGLSGAHIYIINS